MDTPVGIAIGTDTVESATPTRPAVGCAPVLSVSPDGRARLGVVPGAGVYREFVDRVGDPVPVIATDGASRLGADLMALTIGELTGGASHLTIAYPPGWGAYQLGILRSALTCTRAADIPISWIPRPVAARIGADLGSRQAVLVVDIGATSTELSVVTGHRVVESSSTELLGSAWLDRVLAAHLLDRQGRPASREDMPLLLAACRRARAQLDSAVSATVDTPWLRAGVTRAEFDELVGSRMASVVAAVTRMLAREREFPVTAILIVGEPARTPLLIALLADRVGTPLIVPDRPEQTITRGAVGLAVLRQRERSAPPARSRTGDQSTRMVTTPAPPPRRAPAPRSQLRTALTATAAGLAVVLGGVAATGPVHAVPSHDRHWQRPDQV